MTLSATSIDLCRVMRAHHEQVNRATFDSWPVGALFNAIHRRSRILEGVYVKVGADTVNDVGTMRSAACCYGADLVLQLVRAPEDAERWDGLS